MRWIVIIGVVALCVLCGLLGLTAGINLNPKSTVKFVPVLGPDAWMIAGAWLGAIATFCAAGLALFFSRRDDQEKLTLITQSHLGAGEASFIKCTFMAVCTGRIPATILAAGLKDNQGRFYHFAEFTFRYQFPKCLQRGEVSQIEVDDHAMCAIVDKLKANNEKPENLKFSVKTATHEYIDLLPIEIAGVLSEYLSQK